jgi:hypothetical protein
MTHNY